MRCSVRLRHARSRVGQQDVIADVDRPCPSRTADGIHQGRQAAGAGRSFRRDRNKSVLTGFARGIQGTWHCLPGDPGAMLPRGAPRAWSHPSTGRWEPRALPVASKASRRRNSVAECAIAPSCSSTPTLMRGEPCIRALRRGSLVVLSCERRSCEPSIVTATSCSALLRPTSKHDLGRGAPPIWSRPVSRSIRPRSRPGVQDATSTTWSARTSASGSPRPDHECAAAPGRRRSRATTGRRALRPSSRRRSVRVSRCLSGSILWTFLARDRLLGATRSR